MAANPKVPITIVLYVANRQYLSFLTISASSFKGLANNFLRFNFLARKAIADVVSKNFSGERTIFLFSYSTLSKSSRLKIYKVYAGDASFSYLLVPF